MTYLAFHLVFTIPPILALALLPPRGWLRRSGGRARWALPVVCVIALAYTTPWDNFLVREGVWSYGAERVIAVIGYVPVEEYAFFVLQPALTGLVFLRVLARAPSPTGRTVSPAVRMLPAAGWLAAAAGGAALLETDSGRYLGLILVWACPVLAAQWAWAAPALLARRRAATLGVVAPSVYLWIADRVAIARGVWTISPEYSTGVVPFGLPIEEAVFFLLTNILVVQGLVLLLAAPPLRGRHLAPTPPDRLAVGRAGRKVDAGTGCDRTDRPEGPPEAGGA